MAVVDNVLKLKPRNKNATGVSIEEADESWALKLLDEHEGSDEGFIQIEGVVPQVIDDHTSGYNEQKELRCNTSDQALSDSHIDIEKFDAGMLSLSAIENQILNLSKKRSESAVKSSSSGHLFSRIKTLLNFDLLTLIR